RDVSNDGWTASLNNLPSRIQCIYAAAGGVCAGQIHDRPVSRRVSIEIRIDAALNGGPLTGLVGVGAVQAPVANDVLQNPVAIPERAPVVDGRKREALTIIE